MYTSSRKTDEIWGIKRLKKLTPTRKCTHMGPFTHLQTTGITASQTQMKREMLINNNSLGQCCRIAVITTL